MEPRRAIVVGASSGIGAALARRLCRAGFDTALLARRSDKLAEVASAIKAEAAPGMARVYVHDVAETSTVDGLFERIVGELRGLDVLIFSAGVMPPVAADEYDAAKDRAIVEINLIGAIAWLDAGARYFAKRGVGSLVAVSSMAGERGRRGAPAYGASKAGLNTFCESLRNRLASSEVHVLTVKPGFVDTVMLTNAVRAFWVSSLETAAEQILRAIEGRRQTIFVTPRWRLISWLLRALPSALMKRVPFQGSRGWWS